MENEMVVAAQFGLSMGRSPSAVLAEAHTAAKSLKDLISKKEKKVMMNGKQYLEFEDWQTVGGFYGAKAKAISTEYVEIGNAKGFKAKAVVIDANGNEISSAEALCLNDEEKWSTRAKYEWKDGKKEKVGDVPVPTFQLMSMAQTRACAKALRNVFAWVVVLAGYAPTPAEDMTGEETEAAPARKPIEPAAKKDGPAEAGVVTFVPVEVQTKTGDGEKGPWTKYGIKSPDGKVYGTFDENFGNLATDSAKDKLSITVQWFLEKGKYLSVKALAPAANQ